MSGYKEAAIAWEVCASIHRGYAKGKDPLFKTRQADFIKHQTDALEAMIKEPEMRAIGYESKDGVLVACKMDDQMFQFCKARNLRVVYAEVKK